MMNQDHFTRLENMYLQANVNTQIYSTTNIHISEGKAIIELDVEDKYFHALGAIHGSVYFKLLDDAAFFAVNSVVEDVFVLTKSFFIDLKRPVSEGLLRAEGTIISAEDGEYFAESKLINEQGKEVASGKGIFVKSKARLSEVEGYY